MERLGDAPRLGRCIHMRHDDAHRAVVQRSCCLIDGAGTDPDDRGDANRQGGDAKLRDLLHAEGAVFGVDEHPIMAGRRGQHRCPRRPQMMHPEAQGRLAGFQPLLGRVGDQGHLAFPPFGLPESSMHAVSGQSPNRLQPESGLRC